MCVSFFSFDHVHGSEILKEILQINFNLEKFCTFYVKVSPLLSVAAKYKIGIFIFSFIAVTFSR